MDDRTWKIGRRLSVAEYRVVEELEHAVPGSQHGELDAEKGPAYLAVDRTVKIRHVEVNNVKVIEPPDAARSHVVDTDGRIVYSVAGKEVAHLNATGIENGRIIAHVDLVAGNRVGGGEIEVHIHQDAGLRRSLDRGHVEGGHVIRLG